MQNNIAKLQARKEKRKRTTMPRMNGHWTIFFNHLDVLRHWQRRKPGGVGLRNRNHEEEEEEEVIENCLRRRRRRMLTHM
jgi:hypothetical protein